MKFFIKLYGNILNFASTKFQFNLFFIKQSFSVLVSGFSQMSFILLGQSTFKIKTLNSIWKNLSTVITINLFFYIFLYFFISLLFFFL